MSSQITNNNTYTTAPASPNPYISRKLNNMDQVQVMKREREDWSSVTNFIQLVSPQPVDRFSQTKLRWKAPNKGYPHM